MPRKKETARKKFIPENILEFLRTGEQAEDDHDIDVFLLRGNRERVKSIWQEVRGEILREWVQMYPCTRPWAWWEIDAPRWTRKFGAYFDGTLPEPRQRLGGIGTPDFEVLRYVPYFTEGIPSGWVHEQEVEYYNGRARDVNGNLIPTKYKEGDFKGVAIDPRDPPKYESVASYLECRGLLTPAEVKYLAAHPELREPELVIFDDDEEEEEETEEETVEE